MTMPIIPVEKPRSFPPRVTAFTRRFWDGLREGRFETTRCDECGRASFPPKPFCPHCWSKQLSWIALRTRGKLYSQTVIHASPAVFRAETPYRVGIVDLDEGLRIATRIIAQDEPALDTAVEIVVLRYTDGFLFAARPVP
jgi:uncharacterized OB-fold protein